MIPRPYRRKPRPDKMCPHCGNMFSAKPWMKPNEWQAAIFCSRTCSAVSRTMPMAERLAKHSRRNPKTGCLEWTGYRDPKVYGRLTMNDSAEVLAHRIAFILAKGAIPDGLHVLHRCDNTRCIEPAHLYAGTNDNNVADRHERGRWGDFSGVKNPRAKLTPSQVEAIRYDGRSQSTLARIYGVTQSTISCIKRGATWAS